MIESMIGFIRNTLMQFKSQIIMIMNKIQHYKNNKHKLNKKDLQKESYKKLKKDEQHNYKKKTKVIGYIY